MLEALLQQQLVDPQQAVAPEIMICSDKNLWPILCVLRRNSLSLRTTPSITHLWSSMGTSEAASNGSGAISPSGSSTPVSEASTADIWATNFCHCSSWVCGSGVVHVFRVVRDKRPPARVTS